MMSPAWTITDAGSAALASIKTPERPPLTSRPRHIEITPAGLAYLDQHRDERVSPALREILANPARRSG